MKTTLFNFSKIVSTAKYLGMATLFVGGLATFSGCAQKGCTDETADNYDADATEDDESCIPARDKFIASYTVQEVCGPDNYSYTMTIAASTAGDLKVIINNLGDFATTVNAVATVSGSNITIDNATYNNVTFTGSGSINGNVLTITYTATDNASGQSLTCTATGTKA